MYIGVDTAARVTAAQAKMLKSAGYSFVGRYFAPKSCGSKVLEAAEARILGEAGLRVLSVFEVDTEDYRTGYSGGRRYGEIAAECARAVGMPESGVIYFAIDCNPLPYETVAAYLRGCEAGCGPYRMGVYGSTYVVDAMAARGVGAAYWQCAAWSDGRVSRHADVYQFAWSREDAGVAVDRDLCADLDRAGLWLPETEAGPQLPTLAYGDSGTAVLALQGALNARGYDCGDADGIFGAKTRLAVQRLQKAAGLPQSGAADAAVWWALVGR